jgi:hypothetical protein
MPIPHADDAVIPAEKLTAYLLNPLHPVGGLKAVWLLSLGYQPVAPFGIRVSCEESWPCR